MTLVLAADVGGTNIRLALVTPTGAIREEQRLSAGFSALPRSEDTGEKICRRLFEAMHPWLRKNPVSVIGIGFPGFLEADSGVVAASPNIPLPPNFPLGEKLAELTGLPVRIQNDGLCAALGEYRFGHGRQHANLMHITLGTGIGGGLILNSEAWAGETGMAMEFGHVRVDYGPQARSCGCGGKGCVERYASATAVAARYAEITGLSCSSKEIFSLAVAGNTVANQVLSEAGDYLGRALADAVKLLDIHLITIGGGLAGAWEIFAPSMRTALEQYLIPPLRNRVEVLPSQLQDQAGLLGAAALALEPA